MIREIVSAFLSVDPCASMHVSTDIWQTGIGKGAYIVIHDGFQGPVTWKDFLPGSDVRLSSSLSPPTWLLTTLSADHPRHTSLRRASPSHPDLTISSNTAP